MYIRDRNTHAKATASASPTEETVQPQDCGGDDWEERDWESRSCGAGVMFGFIAGPGEQKAGVGPGAVCFEDIYSRNRRASPTSRAFAPKGA